MSETVYLGRRNPIVLELLQDGEVPVGITKVVARIGGVCLDSSIDVTKITLTGGNIITIYLGGEALPAGAMLPLLITAFDPSSALGIAWGYAECEVVDWPVCV